MLERVRVVDSITGDMPCPVVCATYRRLWELVGRPPRKDDTYIVMCDPGAPENGYYVYVALGGPQHTIACAVWSAIDRYAHRVPPVNRRKN